VKNVVRSKGFEIHPQKQERNRPLDFALVRENRVNVLSCESQAPSTSLTKLEVKDEATAGIKEENERCQMEAPARAVKDGTTDGNEVYADSTNLHGNGFQRHTHNCSYVVDSPLDCEEKQAKAKFDHAFFHLVVEVNCVTLG
jgi:hypothetical protein